MSKTLHHIIIVILHSNMYVYVAINLYNIIEKLFALT